MSKIDEPADAKLQAIHYGDQVRYLEDGHTHRVNYFVFVSVVVPFFSKKPEVADPSGFLCA